MTLAQDTEASGGQCIWVPESAGNTLAEPDAQGSAVFEFELAESGDYELWGKVFTPGKPRTREDSFFVLLDGRNYVWRIHDWADNWVWRKMTLPDPTHKLVFSLAAGQHRLEIKQRVAGTYLDQVKLLPAELSPELAKARKIRAADTRVYTDLSPHFDMPDLEVPQFRDEDFVITDFGATPGKEVKSTEAIAKAIAACNAAGGGRVVIPAGNWLTGPIHLKSNVNLHLAAGATVRFSQDFEDYLPVVFTRWEGMECYNYSSPIYANGLTNIAITGEGVFEGQGSVWWDWKKQKQAATAKRLYQMIVDGIPPSERILGKPEDGMRPNFVTLMSCRKILIENVTFRDGPMWTLHPVYCNEMIVRGVKVITIGPNNDGINPDSTQNLLIEDCYFSTGDDCVVLKAGLNEDGWRVGRPTQNVVIRRIFGNAGHGGVVVGSEMSGSVRNVYAHDCYFEGTDRGIRLKSMRGRGGVVENLWFDNIRMKNIGGQAIRMNMFYSSSTVQPATAIPAAFRDIYISNVECDGAARAIELIGLPELPIQSIFIENSRFSAVQGASITDGFSIALVDVDIQAEKGTPYSVHNSKHLLIQPGPAEANTPTLTVSGEQSEEIHLKSHTLKSKAVIFDEVDPSTVIIEK